MSSIMPMFATAPRLKIYIYDQPIAYAFGLNLSVSVDVQPVYVIGQYAPVSLEPTMYNIVTGTMQIVRLVSSTTNNAKKDAVAGSKQLSATNDQKFATADFSSVATGGEATTSTIAGASSNTPLLQKELFRHLDPAQLLNTKTFNISLYMKVPKINSTDVTDEAGVKITTTKTSGIEEKEWMKISGCRITSRNTNITMGQLVNEPISFQGLLASRADSNPFNLDSIASQSQT